MVKFSHRQLRFFWGEVSPGRLVPDVQRPCLHGVECGPFQGLERALGRDKITQQHGVPHYTQVNHAVNAFVAGVKVLIGSEPFDVLFAGLDDFHVSRKGGPVGQVECEVAVLVAPLRPDQHILAQPLQAKLSYTLFLLFGRGHFHMHEQRDAELARLH